MLLPPIRKWPYDADGWDYWPTSWTPPDDQPPPSYMLQKYIHRPTKTRMIFQYRDDKNRRAFEHIRDDRPDLSRGKGYVYRPFRAYGEPREDPHKPAIAKRLLWMLPELLDDRDSPLFWTEGERDCAALIGMGYRATSHHGGAGKATPEQAEALRGYRGRIYLVADWGEAGAYDVLKRASLLRAVGIPADRLTVVRGRSKEDNADLRDHLAMGYGVGDLRVPNAHTLAEAAERYRSTLTASGGKYDPYTEFTAEQLAGIWDPPDLTKAELATGIKPSHW